jgi:PAS domain S-box-containing protein
MTKMKGNQQFRERYEDAPIAFHELDSDGIVRHVNPAECALLGYKPEEMIGRPAWDFVAEHMRELSRKTVVRKLSEGRAPAKFIREQIHRDGRPILVEIYDRLVTDCHGKVVGIRSALIDVTEKSHLQRQEAEQRKWLRATIDCIRDAVITTDSMGTVVLLNSAAERLTGWMEEVAHGVSLETLCSGRGSIEDRSSSGPVSLSELQQRAVRDGIVSEWRGVWAARGSNSCDRDVSVRISPIGNGRDEAMGAVLVVREDTPSR